MVSLGGQKMVMDLIVIDMLDFHVILNMDFLSRYVAKIDYKNKKVWFSLDSGKQFNFGESQVLSKMINNVKA